LPDTPAAPAAPAENASTTPPWGEDFDPARAWQTITNLRSIEKQHEATIASITTERDALLAAKVQAEDAQKAAEQQHADALTKAEQIAKDAQRGLWIERARREHDLDEDLLDFLTGDTEEELLAKAERLAGRGKPKKTEDPEPEPNAAASKSTEPALSPAPGHGGEPSEAVDHAAIAAASRRR
jgi:hypothetical protein